MRLRWLWKWCPCVKCKSRRYVLRLVRNPPPSVNMPKLLAYVMEHGFDIRNADELIR